MAISPAPKRKKESTEVPERFEKKIKDVINRGGQPLPIDTTNNDLSKNNFKSIAVKLLENEIELIKQLRSKRRPPRGKKISISIHDWIVEAVQEKLIRDKKKIQI